MAFLTITDETLSVDAVMFPLVYKDNKDYMAIGKIYMANGKIEKRDEKVQVVINRIFGNKK